MRDNHPGEWPEYGEVALNQQLKTRLIGAIVLISLAVIFIPMLLDGSDERAPMVGEFVPKRPAYRFEPLDIPLQPVPSVPAEQPRVVDRVPEPTVSAEVKTETKPVDTPPPVAPAPKVEAKPVPAPTPAPSPPGVTGSTTKEVVGWVVQVGSFSRQENAMALQTRLRSAGYAAFVDRSSSPTGSTWRVRVGPELKRENAEQIQQRLHQQMQLEGIVVAHNS